MKNKIVAIALTLYFSIIIFMPKDELLFTTLNALKKENIEISFQKTSDMGLWQNIDDIEFSYNQSKYAKATTAKITSLLFYNMININTVTVNESFQTIFPYRANSIALRQNIFTPTLVNISADGSFGSIDGNFDLKSSKIKLLLSPSKEFESSQFIQQFKKTKEGYVYESTIR